MHNKIQMYFGDIPIVEISVCHNLGYIDPIYCFSSIGVPKPINYIHSPPELTEVIITTYSGMLYHKIKDNKLSVLGLGNGSVCIYCSNYNPVGTIKCIRCDSLVEVIEFVRPKNIEMFLSSYELEGFIMGDEPKYESYNFTVLPDEFEYLYKAVESNLYYNMLDLEEGYYLCQYCGLAVREGDTCYGCAGERLPLQELVKIDRKCLFCGTKNYGNLFCNSCGSRISGQTLKEYIRLNK